MVTNNVSNGMPKFCHKCGSKLESEAKFCGVCGASVLKSASVEENITEAVTENTVEEVATKNVAPVVKIDIAELKREVLATEGDKKNIVLKKLLDALRNEKVVAAFSVDAGDVAEGGIYLKPDVMRSSDGKIFFPIFSSKKMIPEKYADSYNFISIDYTKAVSLASSNKDLSGFVLDPFCEPLTLSYELMDEVEKFSEMFFVLYNKSLGEKFPSIDRNCGVWVFTQYENAEAVVSKNTGIDLAIKSFAKESVADCIKVWSALGVERVTVDIGTSHAEIKTLAEFADGDVNSANRKINSFAVRYKQLRAIPENKGAADAAEKARVDLCADLFKTVFMVPVSNESGNAQGFYISPKADKMIKVAYDGNAFLICGDGVCMPSDEEINSEENNNVIIRTASSGGKEFIAAFTDADDLKAMFENSAIKLFTYEELAGLVLNAQDNAPVGIVINPTFTNFVLLKDDMSKITVPVA
ncbi:MAG: zinc-ribbon domain-containing protein [Ruminococcaceae bacterium]|nr:zinc-ribbon domain-containing protein [Oscillospiraceae bacterium]